MLLLLLLLPLLLLLLMLLLLLLLLLLLRELILRRTPIVWCPVAHTAKHLVSYEPRQHCAKNEMPETRTCLHDCRGLGLHGFGV